MSPRECSIANVLAVVGERWSLLAIREVMFGVRRFDQIARNTGASRDILTARLRKLVDVGLLERQQYEQHPPRYDYVLTESGQALHNVLLALVDWGDRHVTQGEPPMDCGAVLQPITVCSRCRSPVDPARLKVLRLDQPWT